MTPFYILHSKQQEVDNVCHMLLVPAAADKQVDIYTYSYPKLLA